MRVLVTGATGFIGNRLCEALARRGHEVCILTRRVNSSVSGSRFSHTPYHCATWDPKKGVDPALFSGVEALIHLAGASIAGKRWNPSYKKELWDSRTQGTRHIVQALLSSNSTLKCFISASAIGYYGDCENREVTEMTPSGNDFLAKLCRAWEEETSSLESHCRRIVARIGLVLGKGGGLIEKLHPLFRCGLGSPLGHGRQWMSWIHLEDVVHFFCEALENSAFNGTYNLTAPHATVHRKFIETMAETLGGFVSPSVPYVGLRLTQGEVAKYIVASQKVLPKRLMDMDFPFKYPMLPEALEDLLPDNPYDHEFNNRLWLKKNQSDVFDFFSKTENLEKITPPWIRLKILGLKNLSEDTSKIQPEIQSGTRPEIQSGSQIDYQLRIHGFPMKWRTLIKDWNPPHGFFDVQLKGPYSKWEHTHRFESFAGGTLMTDQVCFRPPMKYLGNALMGSFIAKDIQKIFSFRNKIIRKIL